MATYTGIAFPFQKGSTSFPAQAEDADLIKQSIIQIVMTMKGERVMRPDFGSRVMQYVFENNTEVLAQQIRTEVFAAITKFEPRAILSNVDVVSDGTEVVITVNFVVKATSQQDTLALAIPTV